MGVKTTIVVDEALWKRFRESVMHRYDSSKKLSETVAEAIEIFDAEGTLMEMLERLNIEVKGYPSSSEIRRDRPEIGERATQSYGR